MGVKEVFTLAVCTLIVCLADLVNWKRRKWSQSVRLIGSASPPPPPSMLAQPCASSLHPVQVHLGVLCDILFRSERLLCALRAHACVCVCVCINPCVCVLCVYHVCVGEDAETEGKIKHEVLGGRELNEHWQNKGA